MMTGNGKKTMKYSVIARQSGFSMVELLVTLAVFIMVITAATGIFIPLLNQFKQQSKMAESNIEGIIGLELLRYDIEHAGYGLPWFFQNSITYCEGIAYPPKSYNESPGNFCSTNIAPRAIISGNNVSGFPNIINNTDYMLIRSTMVESSGASQRWSYITAGSNAKVWGTEDLVNNQSRVILIRPKVKEKRLRELVMDGSLFFTTFTTGSLPVAFTPFQPEETYVIYGVNPSDNLIMPFNRADYYVSTSSVPKKCAPRTGVLTKGVITNSTGSGSGTITTTLPLLDCVADMQVVFRLDTNGDGKINSTVEDISDPNVFNAEVIRNQLKEVRIYVLAHEGQMDNYYTYPNSTVSVGETIGGVTYGHTVNLSSAIGTNWEHYRWKVYTLVARLQNLK